MQDELAKITVHPLAIALCAKHKSRRNTPDDKVVDAWASLHCQGEVARLALALTNKKGPITAHLQQLLCNFSRKA
tara:strand:+ start:86 stop:310 length:225 start_codon:yes stop_codon:yes gene_type:complete